MGLGVWLSLVSKLEALSSVPSTEPPNPNTVVHCHYQVSCPVQTDVCSAVYTNAAGVSMPESLSWVTNFPLKGRQEVTVDRNSSAPLESHGTSVHSSLTEQKSSPRTWLYKETWQHETDAVTWSGVSNRILWWSQEKSRKGIGERSKQKEREEQILRHRNLNPIHPLPHLRDPGTPWVCSDWGQGVLCFKCLTSKRTECSWSQSPLNGFTWIKSKAFPLCLALGCVSCLVSLPTPLLQHPSAAVASCLDPLTDKGFP
jgi:hypothetical protein